MTSGQTWPSVKTGGMRLYQIIKLSNYQIEAVTEWWIWLAEPANPLYIGFDFLGAGRFEHLGKVWVGHIEKNPRKFYLRAPTVKRKRR